MEDSSLVVRRATYVETYRFLVVVGDQSSAESPVLEGLTRQPRLRENGLSSIKELNPVENAMGIGDVGDTGKKPFSEDIRIEVYGPNQEHFSVTDLPNISRRTTAGVSTKVDKSTVNCMARGYMETQYPPFPQQYTPSKDKKGIDSLRPRLQERTAYHIRQEFSKGHKKIKSEMRQTMKEARKAIESLGANADTSGAEPLLDQSCPFVATHRLARCIGVFGSPLRRLLAEKIFARTMAIAGHVSCFDIDYRNIHNRDKSEENRIDKAPSVEGSGPRAPGGINVRVIKDHPDIADLLYEEYLCALVAYLRNACVAEKGSYGVPRV
ncbi:uncharacterized protein CIMG_09758 [Coccidioides immitis RS]|uniref:Uncharacterized protein n=2 Tax=Coccidioides immitis TaxID=5501 RepID=J3K333_COCIM|nr:uncharacterized protein CIMG_09758 [Coccidioides immitis RS]EAS28554.3 hypothetical protein CIMG_09758 [Coccidioides immitis RS]KMP02653.1 hypothetical protein CIRG_02345 [Coccidioides immitis RMSCC 2394]